MTTPDIHLTTFDTSGPVGASVDVLVGDLRVVASDRGDLVVQVRPCNPADKRDVRAAEQTTVEFTDGTLTVRGPRQPRLGVLGKVGSVDVLVELPAGSDLDAKLGAGGIGCAGPLRGCRLRTGAGDLHVEQAETLALKTGLGTASAGTVSGEAELRSASGKLQVGSVGQSALCKTGNGEVRIGRVAGDLHVKTANGDASIDHAGASVEVNTACGNIRVAEVVRGTATLRTATGRIEIGIRPGTAARLDVHTRFGRVENELTTSDGPTGTDEQVEVRADTSAGDILIRRS